jgi:hypothetical protein
VVTVRIECNDSNPSTGRLGDDVEEVDGLVATTIKVFAVGAPPTAADLNTYLIQGSYILKPSDESKITTTFANDSALVLPIQANTRYWLQCLFIISGINTSDMKFKFIAPTGTTMQWVSDALGSSFGGGTGTFFGEVSRSIQSVSSTPVFGLGTSTAAFLIASCKGFINVGSTSGNLRPQWAQNVADAGSPTFMRAGSMMAIRRIM